MAGGALLTNTHNQAHLPLDKSAAEPGRYASSLTLTNT